MPPTLAATGVPWYAYIALAIGALVALVYVGGPILILLSLKAKRDPTFQMLDEDLGGLPADARAYLADVTEELSALGFTPTVCIHMADFMPNVEIYFTVFENRTASDMAMAATPYVVTGVRKPQKFYIEFATEFTDGHEIDTNQSNEVSVFDPVPKRSVISAPDVPDAKTLYAIHNALIRRESLTSPKRPVPQPDDQIEDIHKGIVRELDHQVTRGLLRLNPNADAYTPTLRGAFVLTWRNLWPLSRARKARARRELDRLRNAYGV